MGSMFLCMYSLYVRIYCMYVCKYVCTIEKKQLLHSVRFHFPPASLVSEL